MKKTKPSKVNGLKNLKALINDITLMNKIMYNDMEW